MPTENRLDALGLDALTGFSEETWAEFLLGLAQHSGEINRFFGRHEEAHWGTLTIGQVKEWFEWRRRQEHYSKMPGQGNLPNERGENTPRARWMPMPWPEDYWKK